MFNQLPSLKALKAFESAARHHSFTAAAAELFVTQGAISYQIKQLESNLNITLFERNVRQVVLTQEGERIFQMVHRHFRELNDEIASISSSHTQMVLTVAVSTFFAARWLTRRLGEFLYQHPKVALRLKHSVNDPDFDIAEVDVAIRWGNGDWPSIHSQLLFDSPMMALCSPSLLNGKNAIKTLQDIKKHVLLHDQTSNDCWKEWLAIAGMEDVEEGNGPVIVDPNVRVQSAIDGYGFVLVNQLIQSDIENQKLIEPFNVRLDGYGFYLLHTDFAQKNPAVILFKEWLMDEAAVMDCPE